MGDAASGGSSYWIAGMIFFGVVAFISLPISAVLLMRSEKLLAKTEAVLQENKKLKGSLSQGQAALLEQAKKVVPATGLKHVVSPFDEQAIEAALRIREQYAGTRMTVITLGNEASRNALKHGLAMGADDGLLLSDPAFEAGDAYTTARILSAALLKLGTVDLVLCGRQAADGDAGIVGAGIAELLDRPVLAFAMSVVVENNVVRVERVVDDGTEIVETDLPALVTVSN